MAVLNFPTSPTTGERYTANGRTWEWNGVSWGVIPASALVSGLGDVTLTSVTTGDLLQYDGTDWVNATTELNDNTDVSLTSPTSGQVLKYDGTEWINDTDAAGFTTTVTATSTTASAGDHIHVTAATQTITLPASPSAGDRVAVTVENFTDTVVARNGNVIMDLSEDFTIDVANMGVTLIYTDATNGWRLL